MITLAVITVFLGLLLGYVYLQYTDLKEDYNRVYNLLEDANTRISQLESKIATLEGERSTLILQIDRLQYEVDQLENQVSTLEEENKRLKDIVDMKIREVVVEDYIIVLPKATFIIPVEYYVLAPDYAGYYYIQIKSTGPAYLTIYTVLGDYEYKIEYEITGSPPYEEYLIPAIPGAAITLNFSNPDHNNGRTITLTIYYIY